MPNPDPSGHSTVPLATANSAGTLNTHQDRITRTCRLHMIRPDLGLMGSCRAASLRMPIFQYVPAPSTHGPNLGPNTRLQCVLPTWYLLMMAMSISLPILSSSWFSMIGEICLDTLNPKPYMIVYRFFYRLTLHSLESGKPCIIGLRVSELLSSMAHHPWKSASG